MRIQTFLSLLLILGLGACAPLKPTPAATNPPEPIPATESAPALTVDQALNATYALASSDGGLLQYTLKDGSYQSGSDPATIGYTAVFILRDQVALGDINGDGAGDAVVPIGLNFGGTGQFIYLAALLNRNSQPVHAAPATYGIGDHSLVDSLAIENGKINLSATVSGPNDPACCPSVPLTMRLEYNDAGYRLMRLTTGAPGGLVREIKITDPAPESTVSKQVVLSGNTSVGPFENTLVYRIYDRFGEVVVETGFMVQNSGMGEPSTFSLPLDFGALGLGGRIRVEISEMSMADGSILMLDSIYLTVE
jgi:hypothetical protein